MKTALYDHHVALGARMVDFAGWEMPVSYQGVVAEHMAVRQAAGIFDVSHMGRIIIKGPDAETVLDYASTNAITGKADGTATYAVWPTEDGGCVDDTIVYRRSEGDYFTVANASNRDKDLAHIRKLAEGRDVEITTGYDTEGILAVQGPNAMAVVRAVFPGDWRIKNFHFSPMNYAGVEVLLSRTGYTGSGGFEIIAPNSVVVKLWEHLLASGQEHGLVPVGLGARDTLRLESGYALYGHELSDTVAANESVSSWTIKWKHDFHGRKAMLELEESGRKRTQYGIVLLDKGVPREGCPVLVKDQEVGVVTSGTFSPCLDQGIAVIMVQESLADGDEVYVQIRQRRIKAQVVKMPFFESPKKTKAEV